ncbi:WG repeat-containing protein [Candidatus Cryosericum septentrionale]|uniref:WG repeat-containing protein n=1 Tax=Candidatus Cryosericum septentrionale TaxID=2290913 RepID=A0A398DPJ2_9BACT|nr:WG repeat-containing protein [Candidatus Cryosericum septentrionale]RIE17606.1 WG repeat-containing protein [Candidatus Cryosericum septentrionale]
MVLLATSLVVYQVIRTRTGKEGEVTTLIPFRKGDKWGFCDSQKRIAIPTMYDRAEPFTDGIAIVVTNGKFGCIDSKGEMVIPVAYEQMGPFLEGLSLVHLDGKFGFVDRTGTTVIQLAYDSAGNFNEGFARVVINGKEGFIATDGKIAVPAIHDANDYEVTDFDHGLAPILLIGKGSMVGGGDRPTMVGYIDTKGTQYWEN